MGWKSFLLFSYNMFFFLFLHNMISHKKNHIAKFPNLHTKHTQKIYIMFKINSKRSSTRKWIRPCKTSPNNTSRKNNTMEKAQQDSPSSSVRTASTSSASACSEFDISDARHGSSSQVQVCSSMPPPPPSSPDYGYGKAAPDSDISKYGYGDASPDYGYGDAAPDSDIVSKYGYGDAAPDETPAITRSQMPRRSSMKGSSPAQARKRASIGGCGQGEVMEVRLPGKHEPVQRRRSITFDESVSVQQVEPVKSLTDNPEALWFQENEYDFIKMKTKALLNKVGLDGTVDGKKYCTRGLEKWMTPEITQVKKRQAWDNVLNEQYLQRQDGEFDDEQLALMYKHSTARSQLEASRRAQGDAEEAAGYLKSTRRAFRRMSM
jgi:hypothetical protein